MQEFVTAQAEQEPSQMRRNANSVLMGCRKIRAHGDHGGGLQVPLKKNGHKLRPLMLSLNDPSPDSSSDYSVLSASSEVSHMQSSWRPADRQRDRVDGKSDRTQTHRTPFCLGPTLLGFLQGVSESA